jgi:hypothetical protein
MEERTAVVLQGNVDVDTVVAEALSSSFPSR